MARAMRAINDIKPNWLFDASLMMGTTCPRIALMYSILVAPWIKARLLGGTRVRPIQRRSLDTSTHRRATLTRTRAALQDSEPAGISQQECRTSADGLHLKVRSGSKQTLRVTWAMSASPLGADMGEFVLICPVSIDSGHRRVMQSAYER